MKHHIWIRPLCIDSSAFEKIVDGFKVIIASSPILIAGDLLTSEPRIEPNVILFNGVGDESEQPMQFPLFIGDWYRYNIFYYSPEKPQVSCQIVTNEKPYDLIVMALLLLAKHYIGDLFQIDSDYDADHWQPAIDLCKSVLNLDLVYEPINM